jgi:hypothetical protein
VCIRKRYRSGRVVAAVEELDVVFNAPPSCDVESRVCRAEHELQCVIAGPAEVHAAKGVDPGSGRMLLVWIRIYGG